MASFPIVLVVLGNLLYHVGQRAIPREANPVVATLAVYLVALVATLTTLPFMARDVALGSAWRSLNGSTVLVGVGVVAVELGFLLAYRAGWHLSTASLTANASLAIVLLALGGLAYREPITLTRLAGVALCCGGLWLVTRPP
jgi:drug/metabolite transporter (DMT)-like permease